VASIGQEDCNSQSEKLEEQRQFCERPKIREQSSLREKVLEN